MPLMIDMQLRKDALLSTQDEGWWVGKAGPGRTRTRPDLFVPAAPCPSLRTASTGIDCWQDHWETTARDTHRHLGCRTVIFVPAPQPRTGGLSSSFVGARASLWRRGLLLAEQTRGRHGQGWWWSAWSGGRRTGTVGSPPTLQD